MKSKSLKIIHKFLYNLNYIVDFNYPKF